MSSHVVDDLTSCVLDFQASIVRVIYRKKTTLVEPEVELPHEAALQFIWESSKVQQEFDADGQILKWRKIGFTSESILEEFQEVGVLGLDCLVHFVQDDPEFFSKVLTPPDSCELYLTCRRRSFWSSLVGLRNVDVP